MTKKVFNLEDRRKLEEVVMNRLDCEHVLIGGVTKDGSIITFYSSGIEDRDLVYLIKTFSDRRDNEVNDI